MANLSSVSDLEILMRVDPGSLEGVLRAAAENALAFASGLVRYYGDSLWGLDVDHPVPTMASLIATECAKRRYEDRSLMETKGPFSYQREDDSVTPYLTDQEISILQGLAYGTPRPGFNGSIRTPSPVGPEGPFPLGDVLLEFDL